MSDTRKLKLYQGTQEQYDEIEEKNPFAFYVTSDTRLLYKGENLLTSAVWVTSIPDAASARSGLLYVVTTSSGADIYGLVNGVVTKISGEGAVYTAGNNIQIDANNVISATDTTYTAGENITISNNNVISSTGGTPFQLVSETNWASTTPQDDVIYLIYTEG